jgi:hypothetical protein
MNKQTKKHHSKDILEDRCWFCGKQSETLYWINTEEEDDLEVNEIYSCPRCKNIKKDMTVKEFRDLIFEIIEKVRQDNIIEFLLDVGMLGFSDGLVVFYGEREDSEFGQKTNMLKEIKRQICRYYDIPPHVLNSKTRKREIVWARQLGHFFGKRMVKGPLRVIGWEIGRKDHCTVLHSNKTVLNEYDTNPKKREEVEFFARIFKVNL